MTGQQSGTCFVPMTRSMYVKIVRKYEIFLTILILFFGAF